METTRRFDLLDAVDTLIQPRRIRVTHFTEDGRELCTPRVGPTCGPDPHTHTATVTHDPLLVQLERAIRETIAGGRSASTTPLAHTRTLLDAEALGLFTQIASQIRTWALMVGVEHRGTPADTLRRWYAANLAREHDEATEQGQVRILTRWANQIEQTLDPEETISRKEPCPNPECTQGVDEASGNPTWWDATAREPRLFPLIVTYRPVSGDPESELDPSVQAAVNQARARCRACGAEWSARGLAWELEQARQAAELNIIEVQPAGSTRGYDRCHITDGCEGDEACAYLCPKSKVHQFCGLEGDPDANR